MFNRWGPEPVVGLGDEVIDAIRAGGSVDSIKLFVEQLVAWVDRLGESQTGQEIQETFASRAHALLARLARDPNQMLRLVSLLRLRIRTAQKGADTFLQSMSAANYEGIPHTWGDRQLRPPEAFTSQFPTIVSNLTDILSRTIAECEALSSLIPSSITLYIDSFGSSASAEGSASAKEETGAPPALVTLRQHQGAYWSAQTKADHLRVMARAVYDRLRKSLDDLSNKIDSAESPGLTEPIVMDPVALANLTHELHMLCESAVVSCDDLLVIAKAPVGLMSYLTHR